MERVMCRGWERGWPHNGGAPSRLHSSGKTRAAVRRQLRRQLGAGRLSPHPPAPFQLRHITLSEARSRLYQHRFSQSNIHFAAFFRDLQNDLAEFSNVFENLQNNHQWSEFCKSLWKFSKFFQNDPKILPRFLQKFTKFCNCSQNSAKFCKIKLDHFVDLILANSWKISIC